MSGFALDLLEFLGLILSILVAVMSISKFGRIFWKNQWKKWKKRHGMIDIIYETREEVREIKKKQDIFERELRTNGGSSIKDEVRLLITERLMELQEAPHPAFRCTTDGNNIFVNRAYETLVDADYKELLNLSWRQFISDDIEGDSYFERWLQSANSSSHFGGTLSYKDSHGNYRGRWFVRIVPLGTYGEHDQIWGGKFFPYDDKAREISKMYGWDLDR